MPDGNFMTPSTPDQMAREAEIMLMRSMTRSLESITTDMAQHRAAVGQMQMDIAIIKERQRASADVKADVDDLKKEIEILKARNLQQDGAMSMATMMKDFGPWVVSLLLLAWGLFSRKAA